MYQAQSKEYKHTVSTLDIEISDLKSRYMTEYYNSGIQTAERMRWHEKPDIPSSALPQLPVKETVLANSAEN